MIGLLLALYPAHWRRRYGEEFRAMLESRPLGPFDVADILLGALDARFTRFGLLQAAQPRGGQNVVLRMGAYGAVAGGILWFVGLAGASALDLPDGRPFFLVAIFGMVGLLMGFIGLSAFQAHRQPVLAWAALAIAALGSVVALIGMLGIMVAPDGFGPIDSWQVWFTGLLGTFVGSALFAIATIRAKVLSRVSAGALAIAAAAVVCFALGFPPGLDEGVAELLLAASMAAFSGSWVMLGVSALRQGPIRSIAPA